MINLIDYGFESMMIEKNETRTPARITAVHKDRYEIVSKYGMGHARLKASVYWDKGTEEIPTTGDFVLMHHTDDGDSQIVKTIPRKSKFSRNDCSGHIERYVKTIWEQVIAANFDYVFILVSPNFDFRIKRLERYLTLAWQSGAVPVVILTKSDLVEDYSEYLNAIQEIVEGVSVYAVSSVTGYGIDALLEYLKPRKTIVFLGSSGVGKSSLVNALAQENIMEVKKIRSQDSRGQHTTTHRQLIMLPSGVMLIDTPGMRELGMWDVSTGFVGAFAGVEHCLAQCRFSNCTHHTEPGCAINESLENGTLPQERWDSYLKIKREIRFVNSKAGYRKSGVSTSKRSRLRKKAKRENSLKPFVDNQMNEEG